MVLGSASVCVRGGLGANLKAGETLSRVGGKPFGLLPGVAGRIIPPQERREYKHPPPLRVWSGPQSNLFSRGDWERFFNESWTISPESDRAGYRLAGAPLASKPGQILSEPVRVGTIQVPENGLPIVTMRDGPTVGGYPKIGMVDPRDLDWLAQCAPGQRVRFQPIADET
jgi:allophanate hydrolase subunit 2